MSAPIIITICSLLLLAYVFDISAARTRIPSVILLLILGWVAKQAVIFFELDIPNLSPVLSILGTIGLILIVLEGSLELEISRSKFSLIGKSALMALFPMMIVSVGLAWALNYMGYADFKTGLLNAIPLAVISSSIAIPSARHLDARNKEFVTYESSLSDIIGVIIFNFLVINDNFTMQSAGVFSVQVLLILLISFVATVALAFLLSKIKHHVKFLPIILLVILVYELSKIYDLPALIFILIFGIFIGNLDTLKRHSFIQRMHPEVLDSEVKKFKELTAEFTFMIRALFFLLFGFLMETEEITNPNTLIWSVGIFILIYFVRAVFLAILRLPMHPLFYISPRGLITILLFLSLPVSSSIPIINKSVLIQLIVLTSLMMMLGSFQDKKNKIEPTGDITELDTFGELKNKPQEG